MASKKTIIVVGGFYGGTHAAVRARQTNEHARIVLIEQAPFISWLDPSLRAMLSSSANHQEQEKIASFEQRYNIEVLTNTRVFEIDLDANCLMFGKSGDVKRLKFDALIYAGLPISKRHDTQNYSDIPVCSYRDIRDAHRLKQALNAHARRITIVSHDQRGIELALVLKDLGFHAQLMLAKKRLLPDFSIRASHILGKELERLGILLFYDEIDARQTDLLVTIDDFIPDLSLLTQVQAALDADGLIRVDDNLRTTLPNVYACGAAIGVSIAVLNQRKRLLSFAAMRTAQVAGFNAAIDNEDKIETLVPMCASQVFMVGKIYCARMGLCEFEAYQICGYENIEIITVVEGENGKKDAQETYVRLIVDRIQARIIGAEMIGAEEVLPSFQLLAVAIIEGWHPKKFVDIDIAYTTERMAQCDPVKEAAARASQALDQPQNNLSQEKLALWLASEQQFHLVNVGECSLFKNSATKTLHIPLEQLRERLQELEQLKEPIILYSQSGYRSYMAQQALRARGLKNVFHLDGGAATWNLVAKD